MGKNIDTIHRQTVTDQVYDIIVRKIANGTWKKGEKIPSEIELARDLGVSRVTLKMALQKLNTLGIIETRVGEGSFVCDFSFRSFLSELLRSNLLADDRNEINQFRVLIEYCVLRLATLAPVPAEKLKDLEETLIQMGRAIEEGDSDAFHTAHYHFHFSICQLSGNKLFIQLYESSRTSSLMFIRPIRRPPGLYTARKRRSPITRSSWMVSGSVTQRSWRDCRTNC